MMKAYVLSTAKEEPYERREFIHLLYLNADIYQSRDAGSDPWESQQTLLKNWTATTFWHVFITNTKLINQNGLLG